MYTIWTGAELLAVCCILLGRHIVAQDEESDEVVPVSEFDNVTMIWSAPEKESGGRLDIINPSNKTIIQFVSGFPRSRDPRVVSAGDRNTTVGFTLHNVSLSDAGEYRCQIQGKSCGRKRLFVWGEHNVSSPNGTAPKILIIGILVPVLLIAVIIAVVVILWKRKNSTKVKQNATNNHQMAAKNHEQCSSDEEDSTVLVDNTEYSDNNYFGNDSGLGEYSDIREIERPRIKGRGPGPLSADNIYELQQSNEQKANIDDKDPEDEERIVTDIYAVPMKKGTLK